MPWLKKFRNVCFQRWYLTTTQKERQIFKDLKYLPNFDCCTQSCFQMECLLVTIAPVVICTDTCSGVLCMCGADLKSCWIFGPDAQVGKLQLCAPQQPTLRGRGRSSIKNMLAHWRPHKPGRPSLSIHTTEVQQGFFSLAFNSVRQWFPNYVLWHAGMSQWTHGHCAHHGMCCFFPGSSSCVYIKWQWNSRVKELLWHKGHCDQISLRTTCFIMFPHVIKPKDSPI